MEMIKRATAARGDASAVRYQACRDLLAIGNIGRTDRHGILHARLLTGLFRENGPRRDRNRKRRKNNYGARLHSILLKRLPKNQSQLLDARTKRRFRAMAAGTFRG